MTYMLRHLDIDITNKCNWECIHCSARGGSHVKVQELTRQEIKSVLDQAKELGVEDIGFTGGEPLLRIKDLLYFLEYCKEELGVKTHLLTNGSLIEKNQRSIEKIILYADRIRVTILGYKETHDRLTRNKGAFDSLIKGISILQDLNANFRIAFVPMKSNYKELPTLVEMLYQKYKIDKFRLLDLAPTGRAMEIWDEIALDINEKIWLEKELKNIVVKYPIEIGIGFHTGLSFSTLSKLEGHEICRSGIDRCHVNAKGDIFPCTASTGQPNLSGGNLREFNMDLKYLWKSSPIFQLLRYLREHPPFPCNSCKEYSLCMGGCKVEINFMYGEIAKPNPNCEIVKSLYASLENPLKEALEGE